MHIRNLINNNFIINLFFYKLIILWQFMRSDPDDAAYALRNPLPAI
jgi:hypothetical protein